MLVKVADNSKYFPRADEASAAFPPNIDRFILCIFAGRGHRALMFYILTGGGPRLKPLRLARFDQFADGVWTIEGEALKGLKCKVSDFRVPLICLMSHPLVDTMSQENSLIK